jgi:hypothetical protein
LGGGALGYPAEGAEGTAVDLWRFAADVFILKPYFILAVDFPPRPAGISQFLSW